uniref:Uncharacterized protein n=1 Tax=Rhizophora mucronata TaxID=61149 RepID=A0A2P2LCW4_RHIMU
MTPSVFTCNRSMHDISFSSRTLCSSFKLLLDIMILLSSSICLLNVLRKSSSCKIQQVRKIFRLPKGLTNIEAPSY